LVLRLVRISREIVSSPHPNAQAEHEQGELKGGEVSKVACHA